MRGDRFLAWLSFGIVCVVWGTTYFAIRIAIETIPTLLLTGARFTLAGLVLLTVCLAMGQKLPRRREDWTSLVIIGLLLVGAGNVAVVWAEHHVSSGIAALLVAMAPLWMAIIEAARRGGERITARKAVGMLIGFAGVIILILPTLTPQSFSAGFLAGVVVIQIGSFCWNLGSVRAKYRPVQASPLVSAAIQMIAGGVITGALGLALGEASSFHFSTRTLTAFLYLVVFGSIVAYGAYVFALSKLPTTTVSLYAYVNPVVAVFLGWAFLAEPIGWNSLVAMVVILSGVALVQTARTRQRLEVARIEAERAPTVTAEEQERRAEAC